MTWTGRASKLRRTSGERTVTTLLAPPSPTPTSTRSLTTSPAPPPAPPAGVGIAPPQPPACPPALPPIPEDAVGDRDSGGVSVCAAGAGPPPGPLGSRGANRQSTWRPGRSRSMDPCSIRLVSSTLSPWSAAARARDDDSGRVAGGVASGAGSSQAGPGATSAESDGPPPAPAGDAGSGCARYTRSCLSDTCGSPGPAPVAGVETSGTHVTGCMPPASTCCQAPPAPG
mmetsp:Transcript_37982/g.79546  ORF Transcript_37982/g.79546 Transcript_37982/m.79546 type:complete len:228 (-) Transcript_37982:8390-9073(-)